MFEKKYLADYATDRRNNFNLMRFIAAGLVLFGHSYALTGASTDPMLVRTGISFGHFAVHVFFITSGFLVTASLLNRKDMRVFVRARFLRIFPGLAVANLITVFIIGSFFTVLFLSEYLSKKQTYLYLFKNTTLIFGELRWDLPGVFQHNPFRAGVNGSLWTLPYEMNMYGVLLLVGLLTYTGFKLFNARSLRWLAAAGAITLLAINVFLYVRSQATVEMWQLSGMFFIGAAAYLFKDRIILSSLLAIPMLGLLYYLAIVPMSNSFFICYWLFLTYLTLYFAYVPRGPLLYFNKLGDYSYGMYIYAFPIQQGLVASFPGIKPWQLTLSAFPLTLIAAVLSWHFVEKKALALKKKPLSLPLPKFIKARFATAPIGNQTGNRD